MPCWWVQLPASWPYPRPCTSRAESTGTALSLRAALLLRANYDAGRYRQLGLYGGISTDLNKNGGNSLLSGKTNSVRHHNCRARRPLTLKLAEGQDRGTDQTKSQSLMNNANRIGPSGKCEIARFGIYPINR